MASDGPEVTCSNPDCRVSETGKCVEGIELDTCPHYGRAQRSIEDERDAADDASEAFGIALPSAERLSRVAAAKLLRRGDTRVIAILGPSDAGKTSLVASLYDLFQEGPVAGVRFARSTTLHAFEQACHDARVASQRGIPHSERTPRGGVAFFHLDIGGGAAGDGLALVIGDRAGEEYRAAADDAAAAGEFPEVVRADTITVLVDGQRLLDSGARHNLRSEIELMMQALSDSGAVQGRQRLALALTKMDAVLASPHAGRAERDFDALLQSLRRVFGNLFTVIEPFRVAASPRSTVHVARGHGVPELLAFWTQAADRARPAVPRIIRTTRAIGRLAVVESRPRRRWRSVPLSSSAFRAQARLHSSPRSGT